MGTCEPNGETLIQLRSRIETILNVPHAENKLSRQLGVGGWKKVRLRLFLACGLAGLSV
ncbi:MAG: hypothetical protein QM706_09735 [Nitrospira sp.]